MTKDAIKLMDGPLMGSSSSGQKNAITSRQARFVHLVVGGKTHADAYREAYRGRKELSSQDAAVRGYRISQHPYVKEAVEELRAEAGRKSLLTLNDRLEILSNVAQDRKASRSDRIRAVDIYSRISGDSAPQPAQKIELTGPGGAPIALVTRTLTTAEKIAALEADREDDSPAPAPAALSAPAGEPAAAPG